MKNIKWFIVAIVLISIASLLATRCKKKIESEEIIKSTEEITIEEPITPENIEKTYEVSYVTNGGTEIPKEYLSVIESEPIATKKNCALEGWYLDQKCTKRANFPLKLESDTFLYANWVLVYLPVITDNNFAFENKVLTTKKINITEYFFYNQLDIINELGYKVKITMKYKVHYHGAELDYVIKNDPEYTISIGSTVANKINKETLTAPKHAEERTIEIVVFPVELKYGEWNVTFSTNTTLTRIYFEEYEIEIECIK